MKIQKLWLASASVVFASAAASSASAERLPLDKAAQLFSIRSTAYAVDLSPKGDKVLYLGAGAGATTYLHLLDLATKKDSVLIQSSGKPEQLSYCAFASEEWAICSFRGEFDRAGTIMTVQRLTAVELATGKVTRLGVADNMLNGKFVQFDGRVIDMLDDKPGSILVQRTYPEVGKWGEDGSGVDEIELARFKVTPVIHSSAEAFSYFTDGHGVIRVRDNPEYDNGGQLTGKIEYDYIPSGGSGWQKLVDGSDDFSPLAIDRASNAFYFTRPLDGHDALYKIALDPSRKETLVASNPNVDINGILTGGPDDHVVGYSYTDDRDRSVFFDPAAKALFASLGRALPNLPLVSLVAHNRGDTKEVIHASSDVDPGAYYLLDKTTKSMGPLLNSNNFIDSTHIAPVKAVNIPMSDGKSIPGYLTMSADLGPGTHEAIVLPHGGPTSRDSWGYEWLTQFLASQGYIVLQPNYRGSAGYGQDFLGENAFHGWKKVMSDIHDSTDWLVREKLADPQKLAIVGWSYGGYAALESAAMDNRYKAVVAIAPVTDIKMLRRNRNAFDTGKLARDEIGKGDLLGEGSPINRAGDIHAPVLLAHGTLDGNVSYDHSKHMAAALNRTTKVELLTFQDLDHQLNDSDARKTMLTKIGQLLAGAIGR